MIRQSAISLTPQHIIQHRHAKSLSQKKERQKDGMVLWRVQLNSRLGFNLNCIKQKTGLVLDFIFTVPGFFLGKR